jgi:hypothetical protein
MQSRLLPTIGGLILVGTACAEGSSLGGLGGATSSENSSSSSPSTTASASSSGTCSASPCKLTAPQCGCAVGQECAISNYELTCQAAGTVGLGEGCIGMEQCAPGLLCVGNATAGLCDQFCAVDADCAATGGICALSLSDGMGGFIANADLCSSDCDLTTNSGCPVAGTGCQLGQEQAGQMRWLTYCAVTGTLGQNTTCDPTLQQCAPTLGCIDNGAATLCLQYCDASSPSACSTCSPLVDQSQQPIVVGAVTLGVCE